MNKVVNKVAEKVIEYLLGEGFEVLRLDAITTNSVYIKMDYGVCRSLRISDHPGKGHLKYRFNFNVAENKTYNKAEHSSKYGRISRKFYAVEDLPLFIEDVMLMREEIINKYGEARYEEFKQKNKEEGAEKKGFWQTAYEVKAK